MIVPALFTATPAALLKRAALPVPLALPVTPGEPAKVVTTPAGVILRVVLLLQPPESFQPRKHYLRFALSSTD
jgi:hypothetical protein